MQVQPQRPRALAVLLVWGALAPLSGCTGDRSGPAPAATEASGGAAAGAPSGPQQPPAAPASPGTLGTPGTPAPATADASRAGIPDTLPRFTAREGWTIEAPTGGMRLHQFRLPGAEGAGPVELVVASWPSGIGPREENLRRWAGQMGLAEVDPARRSERTVRHFAVTTVHLAGAYKSDGGQELGTGSELLASWIEVPGEAHVWTVKATGPAATIARWKDSYGAFVAGL